VHLDREHPRGVVAGRVGSGEWIRLRRGACAEAAGLSADQHVAARQVAVARIDALREQLSVPHAASHMSAAVVWRLPLLDVPAAVHIVQATRRSGDAARDVVRHYRPGSADDAVVERGREVTALARTTVDCMLALTPRAALVVADGAVALGVDRQACQELLADAGPIRGVVGARQVLALADDGAESPGETLTRWALLSGGLPVPTTQVPIETHLGTFWADLGWPEWRLVLEYDGRAKYALLTSDALMREKRRQDAIGEAGWRMIRVTWADLRDPGQVVRRVVDALPGRASATLRRRRVLRFDER